MKLSNLLSAVTFLYLWMDISCVTTARKTSLQPVLSYELKYKCSSDKECPKRMKCYDTSHGRGCAYSARLGVCPKPPVLKNSTTPCINKCSKDSECSELMKCCDSGYGFQCVYSERRGFCPYNDIPVREGTRGQAKCISDFECRPNSKCCDRESAQDCLPMLRERPGICPDDCNSEFQIVCSGDHDCPENFKCCSNCGNRCVKAEKAKICDL